MRAIFGEKASDVKDTSMRVGTGTTGTVIDVQVFTRDGIEKDARAKQIEEEQLDEYRKDLNEEYRIVSEATFGAPCQAVRGTKSCWCARIKKGDLLTGDYLANLSEKEWFGLKMADDSHNVLIADAERSLQERRKELDEAFDVKKKKLTQGDDLAHVGSEDVKVYVAVKRRIQPGDKMAGRHGNKGVISVIMPEEDMPYDENGDPVDIVLNPLGVPSRMNVGQVLEMHLGMAAKGLGDRIDDMLNQQAKVKEIREFLDQVYNKIGGNQEELDSLSDDEVIMLSKNLIGGVPFATPAFDGAKKEEQNKGSSKACRHA